MGKRGNCEGSVYRRADGRWAASVSLETGKRKTYYGKTRAEASKKLAEALRDQEHGLPLVGGRVALAAFLRRWLEDSARPALRPRTYESYAMIVERHLIPSLGHISLLKLTPDRVQAYMNEKRAEGLSARTVQYHHAVLRRALGQAERWGLVFRNVARLVSPPRVQRSEVRPLTPTEARVLLEAIKGDRLEALYSVALGLGLRQGEALGLTWSEVDLDAGELKISQTLQQFGGAFHLVEPKTAKSRRTMAIPKPLLAALRAHRMRQTEERLRLGEAWQDSWGLVFTTEAGEPLDATKVTRRFQAILEKAGLPRQRFHDLRHAAATYMLSQGVPLRVAMEMLGHSQIAVTANTYSHVLPELQRDAAERVGALLWAGR